ncbi:CDP-alcohol phosphatidyltransferase family protein [Thermopetrobacter sp. TC1]|uniref:CDP-alcohol phosphatidyltransferase family protein n=1 Tax=Thermopetrobacter sp. TC1 TaxID=1495045 RepID=UPI00056FE608|nr:CDP-alcohol phosphatidyltransferase family protein [Thermopetrobacter sp. TC1]
MASIYDLKPRFQALLRPLVGRLANAGVSANQVTVAAMLLSLGHGAWLWLAADKTLPLILLPLVLFLRMAFNAIDGILAREHGMKSNLGALLNELGDVISDAALYLPFAAVIAFGAVPAVLAVVLAIVSEMTGVLGLTIGASRRYDGPFGKSDRAFAYGLLALLIALSVLSDTTVRAILWLFVALSLVTILNRARWALKEAEQRQGGA